MAFHRENLNILHFVKPAAHHTSSVPGGREDAMADVVNGGIEAVLINLAMKRPTGWKVKEKLGCSGGESKNQYSTSIRFVEKVAEQLINQSEFKLDLLVCVQKKSQFSFVVHSRRLLFGRFNYVTITISSKYFYWRVRNL